jgi:hypothetical protein
LCPRRLLRPAAAPSVGPPRLTSCPRDQKCAWLGIARRRKQVASRRPWMIVEIRISISGRIDQLLFFAGLIVFAAS